MIATTPIVIAFEIEGARYSSKFLDAVSGSSAWSREARILLALAAARGVELNEAELILDDARDLRALRDTLTGSPAR